MSKLTLPGSGNKAGTVSALVMNISQGIASSGSDLTDNQTTQALISTESLDNTRVASLQHSFQDAVSLVREQISDAGLESFDLAAATRNKNAIEQSITAGAIAMLAAGDPDAYARAGYTNRARSTGDNVKLVDVRLNGPAGSIISRDTASVESYDSRDLRAFMPFSVAYNIFASRQDAFSEMFYPTTVVTPDMAGLDVTVQVVTVQNEVRHSITGRPTNFGRRTLVDAVVDSSILSDETTRLIPVRLPDDSNADNFVDEAVIAPRNVVVGGASVPTAPLAAGRTVDLIGLSQYPTMTGAGIANSTDMIDARVVVSAIYVQLKDGVVVKFPTSRLSRNAFNTALEGQSLDMGLSMPIETLVLTKDSKTISGDPITDLQTAPADDFVVRLSTDLTGRVNLETGNVRVSGSAVEVRSIYDISDNVEVATDAGAGAAIVTAFAAAKVIGYDLQANRSNSNLRTRGAIIDSSFYTERYTIPLGAPLSTPRPITSSNDDADLKALIAATHIRNSNNAVTALLNYADTLRAFASAPAAIDASVPAVQGMGRYLVTPFYEEHTFDVQDSFNSIKSSERANDVQQALVSIIRDIAYRAVRSSKLQAAMDVLTGSSGEVPKVLIGTDPLIARYLFTSGDSRTLGDYLGKFQIEATPDSRMTGRIVIGFGRENVSGPDPLSFGTHAWIPELIVSATPVTRDGAVSKETVVQPRSLHVNNLPVMAVINVQNLSAAMIEKTTQPAIDEPAGGTEPTAPATGG